VVLPRALGDNVALADSGASILSTSSTYPGFDASALIGPGFFIFGNNDLNQSATIDLGQTRILAAVGSEVWSGAMDRGVWSQLEISLSNDGTSFTPWLSYGVYPEPNVEVPARAFASVDPPVAARYIRGCFGAGCPHPEALWGSRVYEVMAFPLVRPDEGALVGPALGPGRWIECVVEATCAEPADSVLVTIMGYSVEELAWEPVEGFMSLPAPGSWSMLSIDPDFYPWVRLESRLVGAGQGNGPSLTEWSVLYAPR
jgi:hypothetical protein